MTVVLVFPADDPTLSDWYFDAARVPAPCVALPAARPIADAIAEGFGAYPAADRVCYVDPEYLRACISHDLVYDGALQRWLAEASPDPLVFRRNSSLPAHDLVCTSREGLLRLDLEAAPTHVEQLDPAILQRDPRPKTFVFGDSHSLFVYTDVRRIGMRATVAELLTVNGTAAWKVTRHLGAVTMHRMSDSATVHADLFRAHGIGAGDRVVAVCGEIDVRNHIGRVAERTGQPAAAVIRDVCARFSANLEEAVSALGIDDVVLSCPTPPLDFAQLVGRDIVEHYGSITDRIAWTNIMADCLAREATLRAWRVLDHRAAYRDGRGAMDVARSDQFCHVSPQHNGAAIAALDALMGVVVHRAV